MKENEPDESSADWDGRLSALWMDLVYLFRILLLERM